MERCTALHSLRSSASLYLCGIKPDCLFFFEKVRTLASAGGPDNLVLLDPGKYKAKSRSPGTPAGEGSGSPPKWQIGEQEFEALMRMLDNLVRMLFIVLKLKCFS